MQAAHVRTAGTARCRANAGTGAAKRDHMAQAFDAATLDASAVKRALDPDGILNPREVLPNR
ncbi:FAD-linked oxidase C-terminal domain-containing protein [Xanthomonas campestris pv. campestris]|nr:FAD-linked oxidase C-terminal domain-containing protein [Xanthomonas campestris pv. campestris]